MKYSNEYEIERLNMVRNQVRVVGIDDQAISDVMVKIPRHRFIAQPWQAVAYSDAELPLHQDGDNVKRFIARPEMFAKILAAANITKNDIVLDVGCGSGYSTAIIAELAHSAVGVDCCQQMISRAIDTTTDLGIENIRFHAVDFLNDQHNSVIPLNSFDLVIINSAIYYHDNRCGDHYNGNLISPLTVKIPYLFQKYLKKECDASTITQPSRIIAVEGKSIYSPMHIVQYDTNMSRTEIAEAYIPPLTL